MNIQLSKPAYSVCYTRVTNVSNSVHRNLTIPLRYAYKGCFSEAFIYILIQKQRGKSGKFVNLEFLSDECS